MYELAMKSSSRESDTKNHELIVVVKAGIVWLTCSKAVGGDEVIVGLNIDNFQKACVRGTSGSEGRRRHVKQ